uniref:Kinesin light chain n=1 Tax=Macrostomum lignano TaxID=282301 RepID=A0A1I8IU68_9PLAT
CPNLVELLPVVAVLNLRLATAAGAASAAATARSVVEHLKEFSSSTSASEASDAAQLLAVSAERILQLESQRAELRAQARSLAHENASLRCSLTDAQDALRQTECRAAEVDVECEQLRFLRELKNYYCAPNGSGKAGPSDSSAKFEGSSATSTASVAAVSSNSASAATPLSSFASLDSADSEGVPVRLRSLHRMVGQCVSLGRLDLAAALCQRSLAQLRRDPGPEHPDLAAALSLASSVSRRRSRLAEAAALCSESLRIRERAYGSDSPAVAASLTNLAALQGRMGRPAVAESLCARALAIRESLLGNQHPDVARQLCGLAALCLSQGRATEASNHYRRATEIYTISLGSEHPSTVRTRSQMARAAAAASAIADAEPATESGSFHQQQQLNNNNGRLGNGQNCGESSTAQSKMTARNYKSVTDSISISSAGSSTFLTDPNAQSDCLASCSLNLCAAIVVAMATNKAINCRLLIINDESTGTDGTSESHVVRVLLTGSDSFQRVWIAPDFYSQLNARLLATMFYKSSTAQSKMTARNYKSVTDSISISSAGSSTFLTDPNAQSDCLASCSLNLCAAIVVAMATNKAINCRLLIINDESTGTDGTSESHVVRVLLTGSDSFQRVWIAPDFYSQLNARLLATMFYSTGRSGSVQRFVTPATGCYNLEATGAKGGSSAFYGRPGGKRARASGFFLLTVGTELHIVVGQAGGPACCKMPGAGEDGGTFVHSPNGGTGGANLPYLSAGGGGGPSDKCDARKSGRQRQRLDWWNVRLHGLRGANGAPGSSSSRGLTKTPASAALVAAAVAAAITKEVALQAPAAASVVAAASVLAAPGQRLGHCGGGGGSFCGGIGCAFAGGANVLPGGQGFAVLRLMPNEFRCND